MDAKIKAYKKMSNKNKYNGWVVIDKPLEKTSTQMVGAVRKAFDTKKVGHAGTLDPLATGVVPIALGEATKTVAYAQDYKKTYSCRVQWGTQTTTDDLEGDVCEHSDKRPSLEAIKELIKSKFVGDVEQTPPQFSAIKIDGKRAYDLARAGKDFEIKKRTVHIYNIEITDHDTDWVDLLIECGKGTYIRSIGRDLGIELGCFGHLSQLRRHNVGPFSLESAISLDILEKYAKTPELEKYLLGVEVALDDISGIPLSDEEVSKLKQGGFLKIVSRADLARLNDANITMTESEQILYGFHSKTKKPVAILKLNKPEIRPVRVFNC